SGGERHRGRADRPLPGQDRPLQDPASGAVRHRVADVDHQDPEVPAARAPAGGVGAGMKPDALTPFEGMDIRTMVDGQAALRGDHPFLIWEPFQGEGRTWSYADFALTLRRFAAGLRARGVAPGNRVLVHLDNCPESIIAWLGCAYAGAVAVTTNAKSSADEIAYFAAHSGAVGGITQPRFA